jgi:hypothetical protein
MYRPERQDSPFYAGPREATQEEKAAGEKRGRTDRVRRARALGRQF